MTLKTSKIILTALVSALFLQGCGSDSNNSKSNEVVTPEPEIKTIVDVAVENGSFTTLVAALQATGLDETLDDASATFTVFAPTDTAFELLGQDAIDALLADTATLSDILTYHVIGAAVDSTAAIASAGTTVEMVNGDLVGLSLSGDSLLVNTSTVTSTDIQTSNGIIHVIDAVLMPPEDKGTPTTNIVDTAVAAGSYTTLVAALQATNLDVVLADESATFTVFAPTDDAFATLGEETIAALLAAPDLLSNVLLQHVVSGEVNSVTAYTLNGQQAETASGAMVDIAINTDSDTLTIGGVSVVTKDIYASNGVIHVIDAVIVGDAEVPTPSANIVEVAQSAGSFNTLVAALQATGLDSVLADADSTFTVFAPTDEAFAQLGQATIDSLLADTDTLSNILLYHVISGAEVLQDGALAVAQSSDNKVEMANGQMTALSLSGSTLFVNQSAVSSADVMADNGVIHVVNQVIIPPSDKGAPTQSIVDVALADTNFSTLVSALTTANLVDTLADESATFTVFAPTDAAFSKIEASTLSALIGDVDALTNVLLKHVVSGAEIDSVSAYAANGTMVEAANGENVSVAIVDFGQYMDGTTEEVTYDSVNQRFVGGMGSSMPGLSLYVFDNDLTTGTSSCIDTCAENWPPLLVEDGSVSQIPGVSTITRQDGYVQATYQGRPLYFYVGDEMAGDINGQGLNGTWWLSEQSQTSLQVNGSNVVTKDIYTTNGVIHVIDTVITN
ncbi:adhesin [Thalassotalea sp. M1531]|uniref:Adhesin n=1 Tax=Thalassotalea algicola TaxID=2716224 RepID=A0A7Y0LBW8_9GAMM|nr:fasciclin domain-containing protein [Thalassotalea algicola]NMP31586.1 adhesin [Thalassotalea algicola]